MSLENTLNIAANRISLGQLDNEAQVKQSIILPVLGALCWDYTDPEIVKPEYSVDNGLVDYALLDNYSSPQVFIEAKRIDAIDTGGEEQLFRYASNKGVPLLILTDGNRWDFYLSMAPGVPAERRFYRMELQLEHKIQEYVEFLEKHFHKDRVVTGEARRSAEERHESNLERKRALRAIPIAWQTLLRDPDEILRDLLAEKVESECGTKPELDDVEAFLRNITTTLVQPKSPSLEQQIRRPKPQPKRNKIIGFVLKGEEVSTGTSRSTLSEILMRFSCEDPEFIERFATKTRSRNRNLVAKNRADLYNKPHLIKHSTQLENGWWLGTNLSTLQIRKHIKTACSVAGVRFGSQLKLIER
ncbi:MAG: hypothetical protein OXC42_00710 [Gammaproteobacteria bacterium]|nr:hypothetical protein [Gammaproteobacteria bacterium]